MCIRDSHTAANIQPTSPYTISCWVKRSKLGTNQYIYRFNSADSLYFNTSDQLGLERRPTSFTTTKKFRDVSAWYHIVVKSTTSAVTLYVNGVQEHTASGTANPYTAGRLDIGCANGNTQYYDGYISQFHYVQGQSLGPESFGEEGTYGEWKVKEYTGGHGSTGFYLPFNKSGTKHAITANGDAQHSRDNLYTTGDRRSSITVTHSGLTVAGGTVNAMLDGVTNTYGNSAWFNTCLLYTSPSPRDLSTSRMPSSA